jgi:hypothetical protein
LYPNPWDVKKAFEIGILYLDDIAEGIPLIDALLLKEKWWIV